MIVRPRNTEEDPTLFTIAPSPTSPPAELTVELTALAGHIARARRGQMQVQILVTVAMAQAMLSLMPPGSNRNLRTGKVRSFIRIMEEDRWSAGTEQPHPQGIIFDTNGHFRDGQHRLNALIKHGTPLMFWVTFGVLPEVCDTLDLGDKRNGADLLQMKNIANSTRLASAVALLLRVENKDSNTYDANAILLSTLDRFEEGPELDEALQAGMHCVRKIKTARPSAIITAYYWILRRTQKPLLLPVFWENLCSGADLSTSDARLRLREFLMHPEKMPYQSGGSQSYGVAMRQAGGVILAWNRWAVGRPISTRGLTWDSRLELPLEVI